MSFEGLKLRMNLLVLNIKFTWQRDVAYFANNLGNLSSTIFYCLFYILFLKLLFGRINTLGGFDYNDMLFLMLVGQTMFYTMAATGLQNLDAMTSDISRGNFDLLLLKPIPQKFYITNRWISIVRLLSDGLINQLILVVLIDWSSLGLTVNNVCFGMVTLVLGFFANRTLTLMLAVPSLFSGSAAAEFRNLFWNLQGTTTVPYTTLPRWFQVVSVFALPNYLVASLSGIVMIGRFSPIVAITISLGSYIFIRSLFNYWWAKGLRSYTSSSS